MDEEYDAGEADDINPPRNLDDRVNLNNVDYDLREQDAFQLGQSNPPMAVYQPWDSAFAETDFHLQNPEEAGEIDVYSGHAGTAYVWEEESPDTSDRIAIFYEFDSTMPFNAYPGMTAELGDQVEDLELVGRKALSEGEAGFTVLAPTETADEIVGELAEMDETLLEEGNAEYGTGLLKADTEETDVDLTEPEHPEFDEHPDLYEEKDRLEG